MRNKSQLVQAFLRAEESGQCLLADDRNAQVSLHRRLQTGEVLTPFPRIYARASYWSRLSYSEKGWHILRSLALLHPNWTFCAASAAWVWGITESYALLEPICVATMCESHVCTSERVRRVLIRKGLDDHYTLRSGIRVTVPERTIFDCARFLAFHDALAICDAALRKRLCDVDEMAEYLRGMARHRCWKKALRVWLHADGRAENGGESMARARIIELGFATPDLQVPFEDPVNHREYRVDFLWTREDGHRIIGEFDGLQKYVDPTLSRGRSVEQILRDERRRESRLSIKDVSIMRFDYSELRDSIRFARLLTQFGVPRAASTHAQPGKL
jgi:hypothetical protein